MRRTSIQNMLQVIEKEAELTGGLTGRPRFDSRVMQAMAKVPRDQFVPESINDQAFNDGPLPIGEGQTISQPYIVALMTDLLNPQVEHRVLEIGTGSGYQAAILSRVVGQVYSIEIIPALAARAAGCLRRLGYRNVEVKTADGHVGWPEHAPFDGIIITAAASYLPKALLTQLKPGGRLIVPVGLPGLVQELMLAKKDLAGKCHVRGLLGVSFVPMTGGETGAERAA